MLKILQARLQQHINWDLPDVQVGFRKGKGTRDQITNIHWIIEKARNFQMFKLGLEKAKEPEIKLPTCAGSSKKQESSRKTYSCTIDYVKAFDRVDHNKLWKILKDVGIPDHLTWLLRNLYASQEATVRTRHGTDWFQIGKGVHQGCILSPCLFNLYADYISEMLGWMKHKLESRFLGEISITSDMQMTPSLWQKVKRN